MRNDPQGALNEALLAQAVNVCESSFLIVDMVADDMPIVYANDAFAALTGYAPQEIIGRNCRFLQNNDRDQPGVENPASGDDAA